MNQVSNCHCMFRYRRLHNNCQCITEFIANSSFPTPAHKPAFHWNNKTFQTILTTAWLRFVGIRFKAKCLCECRYSKHQNSSSVIFLFFVWSSESSYKETWWTTWSRNPNCSTSSTSTEPNITAQTDIKQNTFILFSVLTVLLINVLPMNRQMLNY